MDKKEVGLIIKGLEAIKEKNIALEKKYDAIDIESLHKAKEAVTTLVEQDQKNRLQEEAQEKKIEILTKKFAQMNTSVDIKQDTVKKYDDAFANYLRKGHAIDEETLEILGRSFAEKALYGASKEDKSRFVKDMVVGSDPNGGFFVLPDRDTTITQRVYETSPIRSVATVRTTTSDRYETITKTTRGQAFHVGEISARQKTQAGTYQMLKIPVHELYSWPAASQKALDDIGRDVASELTEEAALEFSLTENQDFVLGDGAEKAKGFLQYDPWAAAGVYEFGKVEQIETAAALDVTKDDLLNFKSKLIGVYAQRAAWGMNRDTFYNRILSIEGEDGQPLFNYDLLRDGGQLMLLGDPIVLMEDVPDIAANSLSIVLADWGSFYMIIDRFGIRVLRDPYTQNPLVIFKTTKRSGGAVVNFEAAKILKTKAA